jgi:predicted PurR-regulated permease PerM
MAERGETTITITAGTIIKALVILVLAWFIFTLRNLVLIVLTAIVIASAIEPAVKGLVRRRIPRLLAVIVVYVLLLAALFSIFYFFLPYIINDFSVFVASIPKYAQTLASSSAFNQYGQMIGLSGGAPLSAQTLLSALNIQNVFSDPLGAMAAVFGGVFSFFLIIVFSFYFAVSDTGVDDFLRIVTPKRYQSYVAGLWRRSQHKIGLWMQGQVLLALLMGVLVFLGLTIIGIPNALLLATVTAFCELIPVFGVIFAGTLATAVALGAGGVPLGLITVAFYVIAQQFESNLIYPLVVTRVVGVPPLLVILALIIGGELAGFLGIILSVPIAATIREFARDYESGKLEVHATE